jgi:hypothetical protein
MLPAMTASFIGVPGMRPKAADMNAIPMLILRPKVPRLSGARNLPVSRVICNRGGFSAA